MKKILLYSGGTDSWLIDKLWKPDRKIYIDIHGKYSEQEVERLDKDVELMDFPLLGKFEEEEARFVPFRNLTFLILAGDAGLKDSDGCELCFGAVLGDGGSRDKTDEFVDMTERLLNYCSHGNTTYPDKDVKIERRFLSMTKYDLLREYLNQGGSLEEFVMDTFSCHNPEGQSECWNCKTCLRKFLQAKYFGWKFPDSIEAKMLDYCKWSVIPGKLTSGTYFADRAFEGHYAEEAMDRFFKEHGLDWRKWQ